MEFFKNLEKPIPKCLFCKSQLFIDYSEGHYKCRDCGLVGEIIISNLEERHEVNQSRVNATPDDGFLGLKVSGNNKKRLLETRDNIDKSEYEVRHLIRNWASLYGFSNKVKQCCKEQFIILRKSKGNLRGYKNEEIAAVILYTAFGFCLVPWNMKKLAESVNIDYDRLGSVYLEISRYLDKPDEKQRNLLILRSHCSKIGFSYKLINRAQEILKLIFDEMLLTGKYSTSVGVAMYATFRENASSLTDFKESSIEDLSGVTLNTIKAQYQNIAEKLKK